MSTTIEKMKFSEIFMVALDAYREKLYREHLESSIVNDKTTFIEGMTAGLKMSNFIKDKSEIVTNHVYPPIPDRSHDWIAYLDGHEESQEYGTGATEREAIVDYVNKYVQE